eukprot:2512635-Pleurochrysis_carterae.AAC.1
MATSAGHSQIRQEGAESNWRESARTKLITEKNWARREHSETLRCAARRTRKGRQWALGVPSQGTTHVEPTPPSQAACAQRTRGRARALAGPEPASMLGRNRHEVGKMWYKQGTGMYHLILIQMAMVTMIAQTGLADRGIQNTRLDTHRKLTEIGEREWTRTGRRSEVLKAIQQTEISIPQREADMDNRTITPRAEGRIHNMRRITRQRFERTMKRNRTPSREARVADDETTTRQHDTTQCPGSTRHDGDRRCGRTQAQVRQQHGNDDTGKTHKTERQRHGETRWQPTMFTEQGRQKAQHAGGSTNAPPYCTSPSPSSSLLLTGERNASEMKKTGRTRTRSRGIRQEGQRQPDFADTDAPPDTQGTHVTSMEGTPPEEGMDTQEEIEEEEGDRMRRQGDEAGRGDEEAGSSEARTGAEGESEEGSLSEDSEDSQGWTGDRKEKRLYWKEVEKKVEMDISVSLENARVA